MKEYYLFTFDSTHYAIRAQKLLAGLSIVAMPTLRQISASCGISVRIQPNQREEAVRRMEEAGEGWHLYHIFQDGKDITYRLCAESKP